MQDITEKQIAEWTDELKRQITAKEQAQKDLTDRGQEEDEVIFDNTPFAGKGKKYEKFSDLKV